MACGGCKNGSGTRHTGGSGDLKQFGFLSPRQLRHIKEKNAAAAAAAAAALEEVKD